MPRAPIVNGWIARSRACGRARPAAIERMERALAEEPAPDHPIDGWLEPTLAIRLAPFTASRRCRRHAYLT